MLELVRQTDKHIYIFKKIGSFNDIQLNDWRDLIKEDLANRFSFSHLLTLKLICIDHFLRDPGTYLEYPYCSFRFFVTDWAKIIEENPEKYLTHNLEKYRLFAKYCLSEK